jgi:hypothetical protein
VENPKEVDSSRERRVAFMVVETLGRQMVSQRAANHGKRVRGWSFSIVCGRYHGQEALEGEKPKGASGAES